MGVKDIVFSLGLRSGNFERGMKRAGEQLRALANTRMEKLRQEMDRLAESGEKGSVKLRKMGAEYKHLQKLGSMTSVGKSLTDAGQVGRASAAWDALGRSLRWTGAMAGAAGVASIALGKKMYATAQEAATAYDDLGVSLRKQGVDLAGVRGQVEQFATGLAQAKSIDDASVVGMLAQLTNAGYTLEQAQRQVPLVMDVYARFQGKLGSVGEAADVVTKAFQGQTKGLKQLGIEFAQTGNPTRDAGAAMAALRDSTAGAYDAMLARDPMRSLQESSAALWQSLSEQVSPALKGIVTELDSMVKGLDPGTLTTFGEAGKTAFRGIYEAAKIASDGIVNLPGLGKTATTVGKAAQSSFGAILATAGEAFEWFRQGGLVGGVKDLNGNIVNPGATDAAASSMRNAASMIMEPWQAKDMRAESLLSNFPLGASPTATLAARGADAQAAAQAAVASAPAPVMAASPEVRRRTMAAANARVAKSVDQYNRSGNVMTFKIETDDRVHASMDTSGV